MRLSTSLRTECGVVGFFPTSLGYNRKLKKQAEKIAIAEKASRIQKQKTAEGKRRVKDLQLQTFWDELPKDEQEHARTICVTQGYEKAREFIAQVGMDYYNGRNGRTRVRPGSGMYI